MLKDLPYEHYYLPVENRGRDILPFLRIMPIVIEEGNHIILKIHTKHSGHLMKGISWRNDIYQKLLTVNAMRSILRIFNASSNIGIIGPVGHIVPLNLYYGENTEKLITISQALGIMPNQLYKINFVAGTMFYARVEALIPLINLNLQSENFEKELGQLDGTLAHCIERVFAISSVAAGLKIVDSEYCPEGKNIKITKDHKFTR